MRLAKKKDPGWELAAAGAGAGAANGLFGAGGGMVLVPALHKFTDVEEENLFPLRLPWYFPCAWCP